MQNNTKMEHLIYGILACAREFLRVHVGNNVRFTTQLYFLMIKILVVKH